jgi:hypothetical protein
MIDSKSNINILMRNRNVNNPHLFMNVARSPLLGRGVGGEDYT